MSITPVGTPSKVTTPSFTKLLYSAYNFAITTGASAANNATGSPVLDVSQYITKSVHTFLNLTPTAASAALIISGSFDGTNWFVLRSGSFLTGSLNWFTFYDAVPKIQACIVISGITGSNTVTGSLYVTGQS
jgi:hypothetical protein